MNLYTTCKHCREDFTIASNYTDRRDLAHKAGKDFKRKCDYCGRNVSLHVNDVFAVASKKIVMAGVVVGVLATILLWTMLGAVAVITFSLPLMINAQEDKKVNTFNSYKLSRSQ